MSLNRAGLIIVIIIFVISFFILPSYSIAAVFNVTNEDELREALSIAESNGEDDVVNIAAGIYRTNGDAFTYLTVVPFSSLTIQGAGNGLTILDGGGMSSVLEILPTSEALEILIIKGLTIQNGFNEAVSVTGGGIYALSENVIIEDCKFVNNSTAENGGGIRLSGLDISLKNNTFINNTAGKDGAGLFASGGGDLKFSENLFSGNSAASSGGGAYISALKLNLSKNVFDSNSTELGDGGGVYINSSDVVSASITNNIFISNVSSSNGGGLGASACCFNIEYVITNNTFTLNAADENGGGISFSAILGDIPPPPVPQSFVLDLYNNIVFDNFAVGNGDDLFIIQDSFPGRDLEINLFNNDFSDLLITCENLINCLPELSEGNNINEDPLFVDAEASDVRLQSGSPCIDAGDPDAPDVPATDFFGNLRVRPPDIGAVESPKIWIDGGGAGGGCALTYTPVTSSAAVFLALPLLILLRRIVRRQRG